METFVHWQNVSGYAETRRTQSLVAYPITIDQCIELLEFGKEKGLEICPVGGGQTWGDMILNNGHIVLNTSKMNRILEFNTEVGEIVVQPGVSFGQILQVILLDCWAICSIPGSTDITIGGAISNNIHGKDSWSSGNFGNQVISMKILIASGEILEVNRDSDQKLFEAIVGGMGLLGMIVEARLRLKKVYSPFVNVSTVYVRNIRESIEFLEAAKTKADFSWVWADAFSSGDKLGRGFIKIGQWAETKKKISYSDLAKSLASPQKVYGVLPTQLVWPLGRPMFRPWSIRRFNSAIYTLFRFYNRAKNSKSQQMSFGDFNFPYKQVPEFTKLFRPDGFWEFQPLIPKSAGIEAVEGLFHLFQRYGCEPFLCGIKAHDEDSNMISYSGKGYSIGGMFPVKGRMPKDGNKLARAICEYTSEVGGKIYLAKDELLPRDLFEEMYPRYKEFLSVKRRVDPNGLFSSDMYRRLIEP